MFVLVCYDIEDNKRRTRIHKILRSFGEPIQESVFEIIGNERQIGRMKRRIAKVILPPDKLRYYTLCEACRGKIEGTPNHPQVEEIRRVIL